MRVALRKFVNQVDSIERNIDIRDNLVHFGLQTQESPDTIVETLRLLVRQTGQAGMQPILDGSVLLLAAAFEQFVTDVMIAYAAGLPAIIPTYAELPRSIHSSNERQTGVALIGDGPNRFANYKLQQFVENLRRCQAGNTPYVLNGEAMALNDRNLRVNVLRDLFNRLGIQDIWTVIDASRFLNIYPGLSEPSAAVDRAKNELNEFITTRNQIAHSVGNTTIGPDSLRSHILFKRALSQSLVEGLEDHTRSL